MTAAPDRLLTPRFLVMCAFTFTVFISVFQLLPTAPYHILDLGGSTTAAGMFLGFLTYSSAFTAPMTGAVVDRVGERRVLIWASLILTGFTTAYAFIASYRVLLAVVLIHGLFWSALLSASGAYVASIVPKSRRAEGIGYWGLTSAMAIGVAPAVGFIVYHHGWRVLCAEMAGLHLAMAFIAWRLPAERRPSYPSVPSVPARSFVEWRVVGLAVTLGLISFGYGCLTTFSALFMDVLGLAPRSLFLTVMAVTLVIARLLIGRHLDIVGHRRVLLPCLVTPAFGLLLLSLARGRLMVALSAAVFGAGFGLMYPAFTAFIIGHVDERRRGAAYGAILAAFDTGIGTGSIALGWCISHAGYRIAFMLAAAMAALALPYFFVAERRLGFRV